MGWYASELVSCDSSMCCLQLSHRPVVALLYSSVVFFIVVFVFIHLCFSYLSCSLAISFSMFNVISIFIVKKKKSLLVYSYTCCAYNYDDLPFLMAHLLIFLQVWIVPKTD